MPVEGYRLAIEDRCPYKGLESCGRKPDPPPADPTETVVNCWYSRRSGAYVVLVHVGPPEARRARCYVQPRDRGAERVCQAMDTLAVSVAWPLEAELAAMDALARLLTPWAFRCYLTTGSFLESSRRSGLCYMFRRCRPTLAIRPTDWGSKVLAALCLHPIAYYEDTHAGAMVPTDDVIAHLLLMRGDEPMFWRRSSQHPITVPQAGI